MPKPVEMEAATETSFRAVAQALCQASLKIMYLGQAVSIFILFLHLLKTSVA